MLAARMNKLTPYVPGEQPRDRSYLKLNTNENPYPPSPRIKAFLEGFDVDRLRLYSDPLSRDLRKRIAERYGVVEDRVFVSNGSDEALSFCFYAFFDSDRGPLLFPEFTYSFYPVYCDFYQIGYERVPLDESFGVDLEAFLERPSCGLIFANPNAPTGHCLPLNRIRSLLERYPEDHAVILDEAYIDFGGESAVDLVRNFPNLVIVQTFSKSMSLAGLRLGFVIAQEPLIKALFTVKDSFNSYPTDMLSQKIGEIAVADTGYYRSITRKIVETRERFSAGAEELGWRVLPSKANFVFASLPGVQGEAVYRRLKERGILVRYFDTEGIRDFVRITIGRPEEMERLLGEIKKAFQGNPPAGD
ncbi:MAG: histidinol-phosphate transaminase [Deltaproteobacteria bacterium]|nr:histidinol-phosphate transaminase [Deltaproteobacteria bacterium]